MVAPEDRQNELIVQIVGPSDGWILERLARRLADKLPYAELVPWEPRPGPWTRMAYYVNYALYHGPSGLIDVGFFTHADETQHFLERAKAVDHCVCMSKSYVEWLVARGVEKVSHIRMGFDYYRYRPRLVLGVIGRLDHPRKGRELVHSLRALPFIKVLTTEGRLSAEELPDFYQQLDYVLIPATVEGGPMSLLEGLARGKPVIAPEGVGIVPELGPNDHVRLYPAGNGEALGRLVSECYREKLSCSQLVEDRTWDRWAEAHHHLFVRLMRERGLALPEPAVGFRFGMMRELELPYEENVEQLEGIIDRAARHLYFGRYREAAGVLGEIDPQVVGLEKLVESTLAAERTGHAGKAAHERNHPRALR